MPLLKIQVSLPSISESSSSAIRTEGAKIIAREIGKSIDYVMVLVEAGISASFGKKKQPDCLCRSQKFREFVFCSHEQAYTGTL